MTLPTPPGQNLILSQKARACMTSPDEWDAMALTFTEPVADVSTFFADWSTGRLASPSGLRFPNRSLKALSALAHRSTRQRRRKINWAFIAGLLVVERLCQNIAVTLPQVPTRLPQIVLV